MIDLAGLELEAERPCRVPLWERSPYRLWSLWDMIKQDIWKFLRAGMKIKHFQLMLDLLEQSPSGMGIAGFQGTRIEDLDDNKRQELKEFFQELIVLAEELGLSISHSLLRVFVGDLPKTEQAFDLLILAMRREMHDKLFLYIPIDRAPYFEKEDILSDAAREAFPTAYREIREAGNCYATERYTACVFHAMRAAEIGLRSLGTNVGVSFPDKPIELAEWQNIIEKVENEIKKLLNAQVSDPSQAKARDENRKFYGQAAAQFRYFKDGWRIRVAHAREIYLGSQALSVLNHAGEFFEVLAIRLKETDL
jgi:DNA-binding transcriptional MerR regulator